MPTRIRGDSQLVDTSTDGLVVFLYDEANSDDIRALKPEILDGYDGRDGRGDPKMVEAARRGLILPFELQGDGPVRFELVIGGPLTDEEKAGGPWFAELRGFLHLPTGRLCVETYDSLRVGPEEPMNEAVMLDVRPGSYKVTVAWLNILEVEEGYDAILQFISLEEGTHSAEHMPVLSLSTSAEE